MAKNSTTDIELLAGLSIDSSEQEILRAIKIIEKRLKANHDARFKLNVDIDETVINNTIAKLQNALKNKDIKIETQDSIQAITKEANAMLDVVGSAKKATREKLEFTKANRQVRSSADDTANAINRERIAMDNLDDIDMILQNLNMNGRQGNSVFQQFGNTLRDAFYTFTAANLLQDAIYKVIDAGQEGIETVEELNDALTSLRMATGANYESVKNLLNSYNAMAQELGAITVDVSESADEWLRQGHSVRETNELIKDSMMLSKISNLESAESTKYLTSAMQGYKVAVEDVVGIVDKLSAVDLESATDAGGLAEAMSRTAEGARIAGISMDRLLGMIATTGEITQKSMSSIGESYKTIFSRMRDIKDNKLSVIGDDGEIEDLSNVEIVLNSLEIKLRESNQEFRNFQEVLDEVASAWDSYSSVQKAAIAKAFSGVRQQENFLVMMENWDKVVEYTNVAAESAGTAEEKFGFYLESLESKTNSLKASLENLATATISDELYASVLDTTKAIVDMTAESGILKGTLIGLGTGATLYTFQHLATYLHDATQEFANLGEAMQITRGATGTITDIQRLVDLTGGLSEAQTRLLLSSRNLTEAQRTAILVNQYLAQGMDDDLARATAEATLQTWGLTTAQQGATGAAVTFRNTLRGLWATLLSQPLILVTAAVTAGVTAFTHYKQEQEEAIRATKQSAEESAELSEELSDLVSRYVSLSDAVKDDESAKEDLMSVQDDLIKKLGLESDNLDTLIEKYGTLDEAIKNATLSKLHEARHDLVSGFDIATEELLKAGADGLYKNQFSAFSKKDKDALAILEKKGIGRVTDEYIYDDFYLTGIDSTVEGIIKNYNQLGDALSALEEEYGAETVTDIGIYNDLYTRYNELKSFIESYQESVDELNENAASSLQLTMLKAVEFPDTSEEIEAFKQDMLEAALASKNFVGTQEDIERAVDSTMDSLTSYSSTKNTSGSEVRNGVATKLSLSESQTKSLASFKKTAEKVKEIYENLDQYTKADLMDMEIFEGYDWSNTEETLTQSLYNVLFNSFTDTRKSLGVFGDMILSEMSTTFNDAIGDEFGWFESYTKLLDGNDFYKRVKEANEKKIGLSQPDIDLGIDKYDLGKALIQSEDGGFSFNTEDVESLVNEFIEAYNKAIVKYSNYIGVGIGEGVLFGQHLWTLFGDDSSTKTSDNFSDSIDWAAQSISNLEDKVSDLETILDNTKGWEAQITAIDNLNGALSDLQTGYNNSATTSHDKYEEILNGISDEDLRNVVRDSIENGTRFDIEPYVGVNQEELFDKVSEATDYYNKSEESKNNAVEIGIRIKENDLEKLNVELDHVSSVRDKLQTKFDNAISVSDKEKAYRYLVPAIRQDFQKEIEIAEQNGNLEESHRLGLEMKQAMHDAKTELLEFRKDNASDLKDLAQSKLDANPNASLEERAGWYEELEKATVNYYDRGIELAKHNKDAIVAENLELEKKKALNDIHISQLEEQSDYYEQIISAVEKRYDEEIDRIDETIESIQEFNEELERQKDDYDAVISTVVDYFNEQKDGLQDSIDAINKENDLIQEQIDEYDGLLNAVTLVFEEERSALESEQKLIDDRISSLQEENDERDKALALEQAKYDLARLQTQRTKKVLTADGVVYKTDDEAISDVRDKVADLEFDATIDALEKEKELLQDIIDELDEAEKSWSKVSSAFGDNKALSSAENLLGSNFRDIILNADPSIIEDYTNRYSSAQQKIEDNEKLIESIEEEMNKYDELIEKWESVATAKEEATNREITASILGRDWQSKILSEENTMLTDFKDDYLKLEEQILSNQEEIDSLEGKKKYYSDLKAEWTSLSDAQTTLQGELKASQELGASWESDILNGRLGKWEDFRDKYIKIQEEIAKATAITDGSTTITHTTSESRSAEIPQFHTGLEKGYVGNALSDAKRLGILQKAGKGELNSDEVIVKLKDDELVLTKMQQINIADSLLQRAIVPNVNLPDYSHLSNVVQRNSQVSFGDININCPGITSQQVAKQVQDELLKQFRNFRLDALQYAHKRHF